MIACQIQVERKPLEVTCRKHFWGENRRKIKMLDGRVKSQQF